MKEFNKDDTTENIDTNKTEKLELSKASLTVNDDIKNENLNAYENNKSEILNDFDSDKQANLDIPIQHESNGDNLNKDTYFDKLDSVENNNSNNSDAFFQQENGSVVDKKELEENIKMYNFERVCLEREASLNKYKKPLINSLLGLLFSIFFGVGIIFSTIGLIMSYTAGSVKSSRTLLWARWLAYIGLVLNIIIIFLLTIGFKYFLY